MANISRILRLAIAFIIFLCLSHATNTGGCIESERRALLAIKANIYQPPEHKHWLSSWGAATDSDCCTWLGVGCNNETGRVTKIDLRYPFLNIVYSYESMTFHSNGSFPAGPSKLSPSLLDLMHLKYLDVSKNNFSGMPIPKFIGSLSKLEYLNLSYANFGGIVPPQIGNLSSLHSFDLNSAFIKDNGYNTLSVGNNLHWLSQIPSLRYLDMGGVNLSMVSECWMDDINRLPLLSVLILSNVGLNSFPATLKHVNFTFLTMLDLSNNSFGGSAITPNWVFNITSLMHLDLSGCPQVFNLQFLEMLTESQGGHLRFLNLANNDIIGEIPGKLRNLSRLEYLNFAGNQLNGSIPESVGELSQLKVLNFGHNQLTGSIPETVGNLNLLEFLHFGHNQLTGSIPAAAIGSLYCHKLSVIHLFLIIWMFGAWPCTCLGTI